MRSRNDRAEAYLVEIILILEPALHWAPVLGFCLPPGSTMINAKLPDGLWSCSEQLTTIPLALGVIGKKSGKRSVELLRPGLPNKRNQSAVCDLQARCLRRSRSVTASRRCTRITSYSSPNTIGEE